MEAFEPAVFDDHARSIAKRQYMQDGDGDVFGMFRRVADWVASPEPEHNRAYWSEQFYRLMASKRFCPGGRVLAGAGTQHGNVLNCFVQGATEHDPSSFEGVLEVAKKLALVTKVGGGNGVNLDPYVSRREAGERGTVRGFAYLSATHADVEDFIRGLMRPPINPDGEKESVIIRNWTRVVYGLLSPELAALARRHGVMTVREKPAGAMLIPDDMGGIIDTAREAIRLAIAHAEPHVDFSALRPEGAPIKGSGGTSSGPVSFLVEIFDNFLEWANLGAEKSGPVATLRYVYSPVLRVVRQGGCLHPDTLVHTSRGTLRLRELADPFTYGWQNHALEVATDEGWKHSPQSFNNGVADTLVIKLRNGLELQGTPNHKLKVLRKDGRREWVRFDELRADDWVIQVLDQHTGSSVTLAPLAEGSAHANTKDIRTPETLTEDLAFWLGYLWGDGFVSDGRVGFAVAHGSPMIHEAPRLFRDLFGLEVQTEQKADDASLVYVTKSSALVAWLKQNELVKGKARELELPRAVRQAPRNVLGAFLRGLFEADGAITAGYPMLTTASKRLAQDVLVMLGGLGIPAKLVRYNPLPGRYSKNEHYRVRVMTAVGLQRYLERVGFPAGSRFEALRNVTPDTRRESSWPLPHAQGLLQPALDRLPAGKKGTPSPFTQSRKNLSRYLRDERHLTATGYALLKQDANVTHLIPDFDFDEYYVQVERVTPGGRILTLDISVDDNHTYLANGIVSHNTRRGAGMATLSIDHPDLLDFLTAKDLDREAAEGDISTFNISILVTEAFWKTLQADGLWNVEPSEVPGKYYPVAVEGEYRGVLPDLPEREVDGARPIPVYRLGADSLQDKAGASVRLGVPAKWLWHEIAWHAWATGEPGLIFIDRVNELSALKNLGPRYAIRSTNPCFVGSTRIATEFGLLPIEQLTEKGSFYLATDNRAPLAGLGAARRGRGVTVRKAAKAFYTGEREVVRLETREGITLTLTPNHPLLTPQGYVEAGQLKPGDKLLVQSGEGLWAKEQALPPAVLKVVRERVAVAGGRGTRGRSDVREQYANMPTQWSENLGLVLGWLVGDGYLREDGVGFFFNNREFAQAQTVVDSLRDWFGQGTLQATTSNTQHLHFNKLPAEFFAALGVKAVRATEKRVPESLFTAPREAVVGFLRGLFSTDGTVERNDAKQSCTVRLASSSLGLLEDVQLLLLNFGIFGRIHHRREAGLKVMPDGRGGLREYPVADQYELIIGAESRDRFAEVIGFALPEKQARLEQFIGERSRGSYRQRFEVTVSRVEPAGTAPVYDLTEPVTHSLIAGGVVAHNCGEIPLTVGEPCDLGAINLAAYVEGGQFNFAEFRKDVRTCIRFLDNVLDVNVFALEDNRVASQTLRRLGLGVMGLADALIKLGLPYSSEAGRRVVGEIMSVMREEAIKASEQLGEERGVFPLYRDNPAAFEALGIRPRRNVAVLTVAPTGTTSMLMGVSSGIEPMFSPFMWRRIGGQYKALLHPLFVELMEQYPASEEFATPEGKWDWDKLIEAIQANHGSVKGLSGIPAGIAAVFEGAHDVPPLDHVRMQGVVQRAFDAEGYAANSLSKTINLPNEASVEDVEAAYTEAYLTGCKGITVYRDGSRQFQVLSVSKEEKASQEAKRETQNAEGNTVVQPALLDVPGSSVNKVGQPVFERTGRLVGYTDMVKLTAADGTRRGFLVTVNMQGEHPVEVILTSGKAGDEANADSEALGRVISIALQYGVPAEALIKTLRGINGGLYGNYQGRFVTSKADLIAVALETNAAVALEDSRRNASSGVVPQTPQRALTPPVHITSISAKPAPKTGLGKCPECGDENLVREEGCVKCYSCGYSKCG